MKLRRLLPAACCLAFVAVAWSQEARLIDREPFDVVVLKKDKQELRLQPIELKVRRPLANKKPEFTIVVRLRDKPRQRYQIAWADVEKFTLFEELILQEAIGLVDNKQFDEAYDYFQFIEQRDAEFPGLPAAFENALFQEAGFWSKAEKADQTLALLNELHGRNPKFENLESALSKTVDQLSDGHAAALDYASVRRLNKELADKYPENQSVADRRQGLIAAASKAMEAAKTALQASDMRRAHSAATRAVDVWPDLEGGQELLRKIHGDYPILGVGVRRLQGFGDQRDHWTGHRRNRLIARGLAEPSGYSAEGPAYEFPLGTWKQDDKEATFTAAEDIPWTHDQGSFSSYDVARGLLARTDPRHRDYQPSWAALLDGIETPDARRVKIRFTAPHPSPPGFLRAKLSPWSAGPDSKASLGPYSRDAEQENRFVVNENYFARDPEQPREIVEREYASLGQGLRALAKGEIVALDRLAPWEPRLASGYSDVVVEPYASPSVHFLLPNTQNPLLRRRAFRRAIAHGINRALVLESFQGKKDSEPGELISGPFPRGVAYDSSLEPLPYDPRMMIALATGAQERIGGVGVSTTKPVTLVLAHPPTSVARRACAIIKQHLELDGKGIGVRLHELNPQEKTPPWDLLYVEWFLMDPLTDAHRLLSDKALQWGDSRWIAPALRDLIRAENPQQARQQLRAIHSAVHHDQTVIPLWQLREHYARRKTLEGLGADLGTLYQNVEQWRHGPKIPKF